MKTLKFLVTIWCTKAVHWLFSELCGYGACFVPCLSSIIAQPAVSALVDLCIHVWVPPRCFKLGDKRSKCWRRQDILCKTAKELHKNKQNCRWALFMFPFEVLPFHSRLDDPTALDHKQWEDVDEEEGSHVCIYWGHQINPSFILLTFEWLEKCCTVHLQGITLLPPSAVMFTVLFDIYTPERSNISRVEFGFYANCSWVFFLFCFFL